MKKFKCRFSFKANLQSGTYFVSSGAWNCPEKIYLHRITDGEVFKVIPSQSTAYGFGIVDLTTASPEIT